MSLDRDFEEAMRAAEGGQSVYAFLKRELDRKGLYLYCGEALVAKDSAGRRMVVLEEPPVVARAEDGTPVLGSCGTVWIGEDEDGEV